MRDEFQFSFQSTIDSNATNVVEGEVGNDDGGVRFESFDELVGEREFGRRFCKLMHIIINNNFSNYK